MDFEGGAVLQRARHKVHFLSPPQNDIQGTWSIPTLLELIMQVETLEMSLK